MEALDPDHRRLVEANIRAEREAERRAKRLNDVPTREPGREPTMREVLMYCQEKTNLIFGNQDGKGVRDGKDDSNDRRDASGKEDGFIFPRSREASVMKVDDYEASRIAKVAVEEQLRAQNQEIAATRARLTPTEEERREKEEMEKKKYVPHANESGTCASCGWSGTRFRCSKCKLARYCSASCQKRHWNERHKVECGLDLD